MEVVLGMLAAVFFTYSVLATLAVRRQARRIRALENALTSSD